MDVVLQIQTLSIPQGRHKSCSIYDNTAIHNAISSLTATYADVLSSAQLSPPSLLENVQQAGHIGVGCLLWMKCWDAFLWAAHSIITHLHGLTACDGWAWLNL